MTQARLLPASSDDNAVLQKRLTDYNLQVIPTLPRTEIQKIDLVFKDEQGRLLGGINAEYVNWGFLLLTNQRCR